MAWEMSRAEIRADIQMLEEEISRARSTPILLVPYGWKFQHNKVLALKAELAELVKRIELLDEWHEEQR